MNIRTIKVDDIPTIAKFERDISIISFGEEAITDLEFHEKKIRNQMKKEQDGMLVLEIDNEICGWMWIAIKENFLTKEKYVNFKSFYIEDSQRGNESSWDLMDAGMKYCKENKVESIVGKVNVKNISMRTLYKKFGFEPTHITMEYKFDYGNDAQ